MTATHALDRFTHGGGHCWVTPMPAGVPAGDGIDDNERSCVVLLEDGVPLGPAHAHHAVIRSQGGGGFSHWGDTLFFSTSDNSDPRDNGRRYAVSVPDADAMGRDPATISQAADYAIASAHTYLNQLQAAAIDIRGARILELGPGKNFGAAILLAAAGAQVTVADPFLSPWIAGYHPLFADALAGKWPDPLGILARLSAGAGFDAVLDLRHAPAERLDGVADSSLDAVLSLSVLEHLDDFDAAFAEMARVTRPGAMNYHSIHVEDHQGYGRYLEHLLMAPDHFARVNDAVQRQRGCRLRASQFLDLFNRHGFAVEDKAVSLTGDEGYFQDVLARLRQSASEYAHWPEDDLRVTCIGVRARRGA
jgi:SAM-dependent methyltransferase